MKYNLPNNQSEVLPNLLHLTSAEAIGLAEFEGFLGAEIQLTEKLTGSTKFTVAYILKTHKLSLGHLYAFAGKYRNVNLSKGGFSFAPARFLAETMASFEEDLLSKLPDKYLDKDLLINDIAKVHGELLFIHPFREGNGRTARLLANLMLRKQGFGPLQFEKITDEIFADYVRAVQASASKDYSKMEQLIRSICPA